MLCDLRIGCCDGRVSVEARGDAEDVQVRLLSIGFQDRLIEFLSYHADGLLWVRNTCGR